MNEDIEIYAKALKLDAIQQWLEASFEAVEHLTCGKAVHDFMVKANDREIPVMIVENAVGKAWTSIWFKSSHTPWKDDMACARSLNAHSQCRVRANAAPWSDGADMDEWWQLTEDGQESTISWPNAG